MTNYRNGDIVLVDFIFSERIGAKKRPALILSNNKYHQERQEVIVAAITSNIERQLIGDTELKDWKACGLKYPSIVAAIIQTIKNDMVVHKLGTLSVNDFEVVKINLTRTSRNQRRCNKGKRGNGGKWKKL